MAVEALYARIESRVLKGARRRAKAEGMPLGKYVEALIAKDIAQPRKVRTASKRATS